MRSWLGAPLAACLLVSGLACAAHTTGHAVDSTCGFQIVDSPVSRGSLASVAMRSSDDAWAVGAARSLETDVDDHARTLALHWDGSSWTHVPTPNLGPQHNELAGVAYDSGTAWAVGTAGYAQPRPIMLRWSAGRWSTVPLPVSHGLLAALEVRSPNDAWAVGGKVEGSTMQTLALHWDGRTWSVIPTPSRPHAASFLTSISAADGELLAAGGWETESASGAVVLRWSRGRWSPAPAPAVESAPAVAAGNEGDAFAAGTGENTTLVSGLYRWHGSKWRPVPWQGKNPPVGGDNPPEFYSALVDGTTVWMTGYSEPSGTLLARSDGTRVQRVPTPNPGAAPGKYADAYLTNLARLPDGSTLLVGYLNDGADRVLIERGVCPN